MKIIIKIGKKLSLCTNGLSDGLGLAYGQWRGPWAGWAQWTPGMGRAGLQFLGPFGSLVPTATVGSDRQLDPGTLSDRRITYST